MELFKGATLVAALLAMGLIAGLFYSYSCSVMPGLAQADDRTFVTTMQRINVAILNPVFALSFGGAPLLIALAGFLHFRQPLLPWIVAAFVLCLVMVGVTMGANVPLNNALEAAGNPDTIANLAAVREAFEDRWVRLNHIRTVAGIAAFGCLSWALVLYGRTTA